MKRLLVITLLVVLAAPAGAGHTKPFEGAYGFGAGAHGGAGGPICYVTNTEDLGPGSLRDCLAQPTPIDIRTKPSATGWLVAESPLRIPSFTTLRLQHMGIRLKPDTWPGGPLMWVVNVEHVVILFARVRPGPVPTTRSGGADALRITGSRHVIVDRSSFSWAVDEVVEVGSSQDVTIQRSIIAEGLDRSTHYEGAHSRGLLIRTTSERVTLWRNLMAHNDYRNPELSNIGSVDIRGNVAYDWRRKSISLNEAAFGALWNDVGNYLVPGPESQAWTVPPDEPFTAPPVPPTTSIDQVLNAVGVVPTRDATDARIVADVRNGTGSLIDHPDEVGGWPELTG